MKKKLEGNTCILKDFFFFDVNPIVLRKAKLVYSFGLSECNRVKKNNCAFKGHKDHIFLQYFLIFLTVKSRYMHSEKKKSFQ